MNALGAVQALAVGAIATDARPIPGAVQIALIDQTHMPLPTTLGGPLTPQEVATGFGDLVAWVEQGIKPAP